MNGVRVFLGAMTASIGGAALIAVLVLGRGDSAAQWGDIAALEGGGVLVARTEVYQRHGAKAEVIAAAMAGGDVAAYPERRSDEQWTLLAPGGEILDTVVVAWANDGELLQRERLLDHEMLTERPALGFSDRRVIRGPVSGRSEMHPSELGSLLRANFEQRLTEDGWERVEPTEAGTLVIAHARSIEASEQVALGGTGYRVPYYGDLRVSEIVQVLTVTKDYWPISEESWAVLSDGSRVLVESRRMTFEARAASEWDGFVALVWGD